MVLEVWAKVVIATTYLLLSIVVLYRVACCILDGTTPLAEVLVAYVLARSIEKIVSSIGQK